MSFFTGRNILVTGATGLIGSHVAEELLKRGARVTATLHRSSPVVVDARIDYRQADLSRREDCDSAVRGCEMVILAAANTSGAKVMREHPVAHVTENLLINSQILESSWRAGVRRVLFISSSTVYPLLTHPRREEDGFLGDPHPAYFGVGWMKRYVEKLCNFYCVKFGLEIAVVRPTNVYGPRDKFDFETSHVLPALIRRALECDHLLEVWGDGTESRDFIYVSDFVDALLTVFELHATGDPVNLGSGRSVTIREAVALILRLTGRSDVRVVFDPSKPTSIHTQSVDLSKAKSLGLEPMVSFEEGLRRTIEWYRSSRLASARP